MTAFTSGNTDVRPVNKDTVKHQYHMSHLEQEFTKLSRRHYATFDLSNGYWQLPLHPDSQASHSFLMPDNVYSPTSRGSPAVCSRWYFPHESHSVYLGSQSCEKNRAPFQAMQEAPPALVASKMQSFLREHNLVRAYDISRRYTIWSSSTGCFDFNGASNYRKSPAAVPLFHAVGKAWHTEICWYH